MICFSIRAARAHTADSTVNVSSKQMVEYVSKAPPITG